MPDVPVEVRPSHVITGQLGLFATSHLPPGFFLGRYGGKILNSLWDAEDNGRYVMKVTPIDGDPYYIDGYRQGPPHLGRINDAHGTGRRNNCRLDFSDRSVVTLQKVNPNEELLMSYGESYW